jgi:hypothetical protein
MRYVQNMRGKWTVRMAVPEELRHIIGRNELVQIGLPDNAKARERMAVRIVNAFQAQLDEARDVWESLKEASMPTLSTAAKEHFRSYLPSLSDSRGAAQRPPCHPTASIGCRASMADRILWAHRTTSSHCD